MWRLILAHPAIVLAERDIEYPMQAVLDPPMTTRHLGEGFGIGDALAADVEGPLGRGVSIDFPQPNDHAHPDQFRPALPQRLAIQEDR